MKCPICNYREASDVYISALGTTPICEECHWFRAESKFKIAEAERKSRGNPLMAEAVKMIIPEATIWMGQDEGFITVPEFYKRMSEQQLVPYEEPDLEEEEMLCVRMAQKVIALKDEKAFQESFPKPRSRVTTWRDWFLFHIGMNPSYASNH